MSNPLHPVLAAGQAERSLIERFGLPGVILSTRNSRGRGPSTARALPAAPSDRPVAPRRQPAIIDAETLAPIACLGLDALAELDELQRGGSYLVRPVIDVQATEVR